MMKFLIFLCLFMWASFPSVAQMPESDRLPFYQIPDHPEEYTAETVAARMIDGLGFRFHWATERLRQEDLIYRPSEESRTAEETIDHILGLTQMIYNTVHQIPNAPQEQDTTLTFEQKRQYILDHLMRCSETLRTEGASLSDNEIIFQRGDQSSSFPFWNLINGPIADAIWHTGQIVTFRRASGNPFPAGVSLFSGKLRE